MTPAKHPTRSQADSIKLQIASISTCSSATVAALQLLLSPSVIDPSPQIQKKENSRFKSSRSVTLTSTSRTKALPRTAAKTKASIAVEVLEETEKPLSPRQKFVLATEVVNVTLKSLSDALKPHANPHRRVPSLRSKDSLTTDSKPLDAPSCSPHPLRNTSHNQKPLKEKSISQATNASKNNASSLRRPSSLSTCPKVEPAAGLVATAECARVSFAYLMTPEASKMARNDVPQLQLENGMLALAGKLIAHELENLAIKVLRIVKKRLETALRVSEKETDEDVRKRKLATENEEKTAEKETLASLLDFGDIGSGHSAIPLIITHQTHTLRVIGISRRPRTIEAALEYLDLSQPTSPVNLMLKHSQNSDAQPRTARQLESLAQIILSFCPSIASSDDATAYANGLKPSPHITFRLQHLVFRIRQLWWKLCNHQCNIEKELLEPFAKCLSAFSRRTALSGQEKYALAQRQYQDLLNGASGLLTQIKTSSSSASTTIHKILSSLARSANATDEAIQWTRKSGSNEISNDSEARAASCLVRIAALSIEAPHRGAPESECDEHTQKALKALLGDLAGSSAELDSLFAEVNGFRRVALKLFSGSLPTDEVECQEVAKDHKKGFAIIAACVRFAARYVGTRPAADADTKAHLRYGERIVVTKKVLKSIVDSVLLCTKHLIFLQNIVWEELEAILQHCQFILLQVACPQEDREAATTEIHQELQYPLVKISNAYWTYCVHLRKNDQKSPQLLKAMQRSVESLEKRSQEERQIGLLSMKLEKLGEAFDAKNRHQDAQACYSKAVISHIQAGTLQNAAEMASRYTILQIYESNEPISAFGRVLKAYHQSLLKHGIQDGNQHVFLDDENSSDTERGVLLEWQLVLFAKSVSKNRQWNSVFDASVQILTERLIQLYSASQFPVRRQRLFGTILDIAMQNENVVPADILLLADECVSFSDKELGCDVQLSRYQGHLAAALRVKACLRKSTLSIIDLQNSLTYWQGLVDSAQSWSSLTEQVDGIDGLLLLLESMADYSSAKGEEYLCIPVLVLIVRILELKETDSVSHLITIQSKLGLQLLRLGYSGKAEVSLAKAQNVLSKSPVSTEARLQWHLAYAEYQLQIGNLEKCEHTLSSAQRIALDDVNFLNLANPSTTLSGRLRFNRLLAEASYVHALFALSAGYLKDASTLAKRCATLNRRVWAALENRPSVIAHSVSGNADSDIEELAEGVANLTTSLRIGQRPPGLMSITHDALDGAAFWFLVPSLYRSLALQSRIFAHQGMLQEAIYFTEQAEKIAGAVQSQSLTNDNISVRAEYWASSGRPDKSEAVLNSGQLSIQKHLSSVTYYMSLASLHRANRDFPKEIGAYQGAGELLNDLTQTMFTGESATIPNAQAELAQQLGTLSLNLSKQTAKKQTRPVKGRKTTAKPAAKITRKPPPSNQGLADSRMDDCSQLFCLQADILCRKALALLSQDKLQQAVDLLYLLEGQKPRGEGNILQHWTNFKRWMAQSLKEIGTDFTFNALPESTVAFPALARNDRKPSQGASVRPTHLSPMQKAPTVSSPATKGGRSKKLTKESFVACLHKARDCITDIHAIALRSGSTDTIYQTCRALGDVTMLLSAATGGNLKGVLHPLYAAFMIELPKHHCLRLEQLAVEAEKETISRHELLKWPEIGSFEKPVQISAAHFQRDYIDIIPETWTAISLSLNDDRNELYIIRYHTGQSPFILRLPMSRHKSRDMDEDEFGFEDGKRDFEEIVELSNFSTHDARNMSLKGAKSEWWAEREALDTRLRELLVNIENIWLGGFRGIFSQHARQPNLLSRFQKSFQNILNRHLPSRQGRGQQTKVNFEPRILELFIGLGDATDEGLDLDEALIDLVYFVVDILQFNGERNAYDEIDFDAIVIETLDALRAYHSAAHTTSAQAAHTILILDKNLHAFPWESLPSLQALSISRLPSLASLRERLLSARPSRSATEYAPSGHYISSKAGGTSILNPSGDLTHTQKMLRPHLEGMEGTWTHYTSRIPTEKEFETALEEDELVLYFGHGSGAQYIRSRAVKKLYPNRSREAEATKPSCATTFLFGCSSAHLTENGVFEPSGMLSSYLIAGAPAVLGMLWDVTDKDCDRFSVRTGELWGLWPQSKQDADCTISMKGKGKGKVTQRVAEVESARGAAMGRRGRKAATVNDEAGGSDAEGSTERERQRGVGLDEAVRDARDACVLRYLNGAAAVIYGIPVYLD